MALATVESVEALSTTMTSASGAVCRSDSSKPPIAAADWCVTVTIDNSAILCEGIKCVVVFFGVCKPANRSRSAETKCSRAVGSRNGRKE